MKDIDKIDARAESNFKTVTYCCRIEPMLITIPAGFLHPSQKIGDEISVRLQFGDRVSFHRGRLISLDEREAKIEPFIEILNSPIV